MYELIALDSLDLVWALGIVALIMGASLVQNLGLESQVAIATGRTILQLTVVGYALEFIFALNHPLAVGAILLVMVAIAGTVAKNRIDKNQPQLLPLVWFSLVMSLVLSLGYGILVIIQPDPWYQPQYLIPLGGMVLGNAMNGAALAGERLTSSLKNHQREIETHLCLGASPEQAIAQYRQDAIKVGLIPILNQMMVVGLVSLPGMFTGQVLGGSSPLEAASYQILILILVLGSNFLTTLLITRGIFQRFFTGDAQYRPQ